MEEVVSILAFSFGATLSIGLVRAVQGGFRTLAVQTLRAGMCAGAAIGQARDALATTVSEARTEHDIASAAPSEPAAATRRQRSRSRKATPVTIEIATE